MQPVTLINAFEVPAGEEEQFLKSWHETAEVLRQAPGFISTRLHESLDPQAKFRFINVAQWESAQHFQEAMKARADAFRQDRGKFVANPALYRVISE
jgi:heme-degrading monooxygenase HmoA